MEDENALYLLHIVKKRLDSRQLVFLGCDGVDNAHEAVARVTVKARTRTRWLSSI
jgi:hypothetical protein